MGTVFDYLKWRGDISFAADPLNEVDNLILSEIVYFEFSEIMGNDKTITLGEAYSRNLIHSSSYNYATNDPVPLLKAVSETSRFKNVKVRDFINIIDPDKAIQFAAATFVLPDKNIFVAFRGTDNSLVGWREDFNQSFLEESPAQREAVKYLQRVLRKTRKSIIVGGHSKGGNLAIYASAFCGMFHRIDTVYSNDGPGFNQHITDTEDYKNILPKVILIMPDSSIVGILYNNKDDKILIQSSEYFGRKQHSPYTWLVEGARFIRADRQTSTSLYFDEAFNGWLDALSPEEKEHFVTTLFDILDASGASTLAELGDNKREAYNGIMKAIKELSSASKDKFKESLKKLAQVSRKSLLSDSKKG